MILVAVVTILLCISRFSYAHLGYCYAYSRFSYAILRFSYAHLRYCHAHSRFSYAILRFSYAHLGYCHAHSRFSYATLRFSYAHLGFYAVQSRETLFTSPLHDLPLFFTVKAFTKKHSTRTYFFVFCFLLYPLRRYTSPLFSLQLKFSVQ